MNSCKRFKLQKFSQSSVVLNWKRINKFYSSDHFSSLTSKLSCRNWTDPCPVHKLNSGSWSLFRMFLILLRGSSDVNAAIEAAHNLRLRDCWRQHCVLHWDDIQFLSGIWKNKFMSDRNRWWIPSFRTTLNLLQSATFFIYIYTLIRDDQTRAQTFRLRPQFACSFVRIVL